MRIEIQKFSEMMDQKLNKRQAKYDGDTWREYKVQDLLDHLELEVIELRKAVDTNTNISEEAADVANMAMFVADVCGVL